MGFITFIEDPLVISTLIITLVFGTQLVRLVKGTSSNRVPWVPYSFGIIVSILVFILFIDMVSTSEGFGEELAMPFLLISALILFAYFMLVKYSVKNKKLAYFLYIFLTSCGVMYLSYNLAYRF
ncbi:hypothetical protein [Paenibacillus roseipurpureus]|uniref:Uncharacterized protein n=1 Tax=Paenibacillus roseopurpureus TaxID=2918901 RepID=A0AA96RMM2_9BACL|nr:hypothetical protein [Paenibacillus sp. MBLB1832]WNR44437.1 hypothetical protein MJB10_25800 [Paenibacillus sp. MBLB1832]